MCDFGVCSVEEETLFYMGWQGGVPQCFTYEGELCLCPEEVRLRREGRREGRA